MPANVNVSGEVWRHALNAVRFRPGDPIEWWEDGSRWRGVVVESDHATFRVKVRGAPDPAPPATEAKCPACEGNGFTLETVNECCGHGTPSGDCCGDPVPGQEQVGCERCQTTGKVATPPAPEARKDG